MAYLSEGFQAILLGEDILVLSDDDSFAAISKLLPCVVEKRYTETLTLVETPHSRTIEEVTIFLRKMKFVKTLIYNVDGKAVAVMVRGDRDVSEAKAT